MEGHPAAVDLRDVMIRFGDFTAVKSMNLTVGETEFVAVVGPTGCGKSTILNTVTGLLKPAAGDVRIFGKPLAGLNDQSGYILQQEGLLPWKNAQDNVGLGLVFQGKSVEQARERARPWLAKVGLKGFDPESAKVPLTVLADYDPKIAAAKIELSKTFTNAFAERAAQHLK